MNISYSHTYTERKEKKQRENLKKRKSEREPHRIDMSTILLHDFGSHSMYLSFSRIKKRKTANFRLEFVWIHFVGSTLSCIYIYTELAPKDKNHKQTNEKYC